MLFDKELLNDREGDSAKIEFEQFLSNTVTEHKEEFLAFDKAKDRADEFFSKFLNGDDKYKSMFKVLIFVFTMSHGQSQVERGFNINGDIIVENMRKESLIAQRSVYDHMKSNGLEAHTISIDKELQCSTLTSYSKYKNALQEKKQDVLETSKKEKLAAIDVEINDVNRKIADIKTTISELERSGYSCYDEAEKTDADVVILVTKGNAFRNTAKAKKQTLKDLETAKENLAKDRGSIK